MKFVRECPWQWTPNRHTPPPSLSTAPSPTHTHTFSLSPSLPASLTGMARTPDRHHPPQAPDNGRKALQIDMLREANP